MVLGAGVVKHDLVGIAEKNPLQRAQQGATIGCAGQEEGLEVFELRARG